MGVDRRDQDDSLGRHRGAEPAADVGRPKGRQGQRHFAAGGAAADRIAAIGGPVVGRAAPSAVLSPLETALTPALSQREREACGAVLSQGEREVGRPALEWVLLGQARRVGGGQGPEAPELGLHEAAAGVGGCVEEPVGGHDAVLAGAADPVVSRVVVVHEVHQLDSPLAGQQVSIGRLLAIAPVVVADGPEILRDRVGPLNLAALEVATLEEVGPEPDEPGDHQHVDRRLEADLAGAAPKDLAVVGRHGGELLVVGQQHDAVGDHQRGHRPAGLSDGVDARLSLLVLGPGRLLGRRAERHFPPRFAGIAIQANDVPSGLEEDAAIGGGQRQRHQRFAPRG